MSRTVRRLSSSKKCSLKNRDRSRDAKIERLDNWYTIPTDEVVEGLVSFERLMSDEMLYEWREMMTRTFRELFV